MTDPFADINAQAPCGALNCQAVRRIELLAFRFAVDRLIYDELVCPLCREKRREYRALPPERRPPALGPCYLHVSARDELIRGAR